MADGRILNVNNIGFCSLITAVLPSSLEDRVQTPWSGILSELFPLSAGYTVTTKAAVLANNSIPDSVVIEVRDNGARDSRRHILPSERQIFIVELKRPSADTPGTWAATANEQLREYIELTTNNTANRMFGAVGIGTKVQFWKYDNAGIPNMQSMHSGTIDLGDANNRVEFEAWIDYIKANGWNYASS